MADIEDGAAHDVQMQHWRLRGPRGSQRAHLLGQGVQEEVAIEHAGPFTLVLLLLLTPQPLRARARIVPGLPATVPSPAPPRAAPGSAVTRSSRRHASSTSSASAAHDR